MKNRVMQPNVVMWKKWGNCGLQQIILLPLLGTWLGLVEENLLINARETHTHNQTNKTQQSRTACQKKGVYGDTIMQ